MPVPTAITDLSTTAASNSPGGSENVFPDLDNYVRAGYAFIAQLYNGTVTLQTATVGAGGLTVSGSTALNGNATLGDASGDVILVNGALRAYGGTTLGDASGDALLINSTAATLGGNLNIDSGTLFIDATNNRIGINETSPSTRAEIDGTLYVNTGAIWCNRATGTAATTDGVLQLRINGSASSYIGTPASGAIAFYGATATEGARFSATAFALQLGQSGTPLGKLEMNNASTDGLHCANFQTDGVNVFRVENDGDVKNQNNSYGAISDAKLKENIADASPKLDKLRQIKVRTFNLIGSDLKQIGVVAQELREVFPSLVDEDADGTLSVKYSVLVPILVKAVQELAAKVDALEAK